MTTKVCRVGLPVEYINITNEAIHDMIELGERYLSDPTKLSEEYKKENINEVATKAVRLYPNEVELLKTLSTKTKIPQTRITAFLTTLYVREREFTSEYPLQLVKELERLGYKVTLERIDES